MGSDDGFPVIEILANVGDELQIDDPIVLLESDKTTMEVPATVAGKLTEVTVNVGDSLKTGDLVAKIESANGAADTTSDKPAAEKPAEPVAEKTVEATTSNTDSLVTADMLSVVLI